jgi:hypothetical protein
MDIKLNRHFYTGYGRITTFLQVINVFNRKNVQSEGFDYTEDSSGNKIYLKEKNYWFGIMPAAGISWEF